MNLKNIFSIFFISVCITGSAAQEIPLLKTSLVGNRIVEFVPKGFDKNKTPSLILVSPPNSKGKIPSDWTLTPKFTLKNNNAGAVLNLEGNISLYGGGEVTGPLLRNGKSIKLWNTDTGAYSVEGGKRLYQTHPWVMGVRPDGSAFGIIFDSTWKAELITNSNQIIYNSEGSLFKVYIIDRKSPQEVIKGLSELTGTIKLPPRWALGYHQCRFSYDSEKRVMEIADTFREKKIPCDVIWMDIDYMQGYRVFTFDSIRFKNPKVLNDNLHKKGFKAVYMIDPGVKVDKQYSVYNTGTKNDVWVKKNNGEEYHGKVWPGDCAFPDFTNPSARKWWGGLYKDFLSTGIDGVWNDMNEPAVNDNDFPEDKRLGTMPYDTPHKGGGNLPQGSHLLYHNAYGRLMVEASFEGILKANPAKRPFLLTRSNLLGGQRYAATWTGDNYASVEHMKLSVPMSLTLGLSGQPFNGPDIGGFLGDTNGDLWANWLGFGAFMPFARGHACAGTNNKEPWAYGEEIEKTSRIALERRYRLLPYLYTLFYESSKNGMPVMSPVFFADTKDPLLRAEDQVFLLGENLLVVPAFAKEPALPAGIWEELNLIEGEKTDKYQAKLSIKGGSIIPAGKVIQNAGENSFDPLSLFVCLDADGIANGKLYIDSGDGFGFEKGDYAMLTFNAVKNNDTVVIKVSNAEGKRNINEEVKKINVTVLLNGKTYTGSGTLTDGITIALK
ncbi:TIM-barrel domain-containing protein [Flavobacterium aquicola]|uniref:Alpha-glucosidase n=1 Tax=Flavobacterium aquicola TaxID=1682742 RepID=A0A3E0E935_9FLAO|nr:TIM-barrel domain-containing protein [Flavobacterium aquicola]REG94758.1 alpha-glucosidase [Flavobacterium aquicola]